MMQLPKALNELRMGALATALVALAACTEEGSPPVEFPPSLEPIGDGVRIENSDCRLLQVNEAIEKWQDEGASLIGCPDEASADLVPGSVVGIVDGFFIVATPQSEGD